MDFIIADSCTHVQKNLNGYGIQLTIKSMALEQIFNGMNEITFHAPEILQQNSQNLSNVFNNNQLGWYLTLDGLIKNTSLANVQSIGEAKEVISGLYRGSNWFQNDEEDNRVLDIINQVDFCMSYDVLWCVMMRNYVLPSLYSLQIVS